MARYSFADYLERARALLAAGFTTKQARKDALDYVNSAYDLAKRGFSDGLLAARDAGTMDDRSEAWRKLYYGVPDCHVWKAAKHAALYAQWPEHVAQATECAELRATIKAAPDMPKPPPVRTAKQLAKDAHARECQICGRQIFAERGKVAHHGYERPGHGWQTASCYGAMRAPYTADRDALLELIPAQVASLAQQRAALADAKAERIPITRYFTRGRDYRNRQTHCVTFTRETLAAAIYFARPAFGEDTIRQGGLVFDYETSAEISVFDKCKRQDIAERAARIAETKAFLKYLEGRRDAWTKREAWDASAKTWKACD